MNPIFFGGAVGVALMYFLDPSLGRRRRARTRDKVVRAARVVNEGAKVTARDTVHRVQGAWAEARKIFEPEEITDDVLIGRVRAELSLVAADTRSGKIVWRSIAVGSGATPDAALTAALDVVLPFQQ